MTDFIRLRENVAAEMEDLVGEFGPGAKLTVLVRVPGHPQHDFTSTNDDLAEVAAMIERRQAAAVVDACFICDAPFQPGDMVLNDTTEGLGHRACFGEDRAGYVKDIETGEPLGPDDPIPAGFPYVPPQVPS